MEQILNDLADLFELIEKSGTTNPLDVIVQHEKALKVQAEKLENTELFKESTHRFDGYILYVTKKYKETGIRVDFVWRDFLYKVDKAPTGIHLKAVVVFMIPAIIYFYKQWQDENSTTETAN